MAQSLLKQAPTRTWNTRKTPTPGLASPESTSQTFRCQMVLWRVPFTTNIIKGTPWVEELHCWQAPRTNASGTIVTRTESRIKYGTWYHIPYCHEYVAIALHNDVEIVLLRFPAVDIADTINKLLWFKKKKFWWLVMLARYTLCIGGGNSPGKACDLIFESGALFDESIPLLFGHLNDRDVLLRCG